MSIRQPLGAYPFVSTTTNIVHTKDGAVRARVRCAADTSAGHVRACTNDEGFVGLEVVGQVGGFVLLAIDLEGLDSPNKYKYFGRA